MSVKAGWLRERGSDRSARLLGLIRRRLRLSTGRPARAPVPSIRLHEARTITPAAIEAGAATVLQVPSVREERRHRGTVYVADIDVFLEEAGERHRPSGPPDQDADQSDDRWRTNGDTARDENVSFARLLAAALQLPLELLLSNDGPLEWPGTLLPYQVEGVQALCERTSLLLADDMGLGKTIQAIAALRLLAHRRLVRSALVVAPAGLLFQWRDELRRWAPELRISTISGEPSDRAWQWRVPAHVYLIGYETLRADYTGNPHAPVARPWDLVVLDEAQRIKNADTDISRVCKRLRRARGWALTGTPLENSLDDLASILQWVEQAPPRSSWHLVGPAEIRERLRQVQLRRKKADVLTDLPPKLFSSVVLPLTEAQRVAYDRAEQQGIVALHALGAEVRIQNVLELIVRLKQICNFDPETGRSSKMSDLKERIRTLAAEGHKALVFSQFANRENGARAIAARLGLPALVYAGDLSAAERERVLARFRQDDHFPALVLALRAGGQGLNLQQASYVFHFDRWWNPAVEQQAESRSHRMGQTYPVNVYAYVSENTIEKRVESILRQKQSLFDEIVDDATIDIASHLTADELFGLFDLRPPG